VRNSPKRHTKELYTIHTMYKQCDEIFICADVRAQLARCNRFVRSAYNTQNVHNSRMKSLNVLMCVRKSTIHHAKQLHARNKRAQTPACQTGQTATYTINSYIHYGVARVSRIDKIIGIFCRISSLLWGSFAKETYNFIDPTNRSHPIYKYM